MGSSPNKQPIPGAIWLLAGISSLLMSGFGMVIPLLPVYGKELGASPLELGLLVASFFLGRVVTQIPAGFAADRFGRRLLLMIALVGYTLTCLGFALAQNALVLIFFRLLQGASSGIYSVAARALISDLCIDNGRGIGQGIYSSSVNMGFVAGPILGAYLASQIGLAAPFWLAAISSALSFIAMLFVTVPKASVNVRPPKAGSRRRALKPWIFKRFQVIAIANLTFMAGLSVIMTLFPIAGDSEMPGGIAFVGIALTVSGLFGLIFAPLAGHLSDRLGRLPLLFSGALFAAAEGAVLFLTRDPFWVVLCFALGGIGVAAFSNGLHALIGDLTRHANRGIATGFVGLAGETGGIVGALIAPLVWARTDLQIPFGIQPILAVFTILSLLALLRRKAPGPIEPAVVSENIQPG